jgi:hypothetical protein
MAEYIEREALREAFIKHFDAVYDDGKLVFSDHICTAEDCEDILKLVAELPTADVVPVVRCKDCKFYEPYKKPVEDFDGECIARDCEADETDFCNYGERRCSG